MAKGTRGFRKLEGVTVVKVDASCINSVGLIGSDGTTYRIDVEVGPLGIGELRLTRASAPKSILPEVKLTPIKRNKKDWLYPPVKKEHTYD